MADDGSIKVIRGGHMKTQEHERRVCPKCKHKGMTVMARLASDMSAHRWQCGVRSCGHTWTPNRIKRTTASYQSGGIKSWAKFTPEKRAARMQHMWDLLWLSKQDKRVAKMAKLKECFENTTFPLLDLAGIIKKEINLLPWGASVTEEQYSQIYKFVAWWLGAWGGDGFSNGGHVICQNDDKEGVVARFREGAAMLHLHVQETNVNMKCHNYRLSTESDPCKRNTSQLNLLNRVIQVLGVRIKTGKWDKAWNDGFYNMERDLMLHMLAGWLDTDGCKVEGHYVFVQTRDNLMLGVCSICWRLGFSPNMTTNVPASTPKGGRTWTNRLTINRTEGHPLSDIPVVCAYKKF